MNGVNDILCKITHSGSFAYKDFTTFRVYTFSRMGSKIRTDYTLGVCTGLTDANILTKTWLSDTAGLVANFLTYSDIGNEGGNYGNISQYFFSLIKNFLKKSRVQIFAIFINISTNKN